MSILIFINKVFAIIRIALLSFTALILIRGILGNDIPSLLFYLDLCLFFSIVHFFLDYISYHIYKKHPISYTITLTIFWIFFVKFSGLGTFLVNDQYGVQTLFSSITLTAILVYLYETLTLNNVFFSKIKISSRMLITLSFLFVIAIGTLLLMLPVARQPQTEVIRFVDAFFTAVSAVCVTGLTVLDTATYFSRFGQIVIICLIQVGALGLVTITITFISLLGKKISVSGQLSTKDSTSIFGEFSLIQFLSFTLTFTLFCELLIAMSFFTEFRKLLPFHDAIFYSIFHAISAFCNAGFSLFSHSFMGFQSNLTINITTMLAIITGGIGFSAWMDLRSRLFSSNNKKLSLQSLIAFRLSAILTIAGFIGFFILEYNYSLAELSLADKLIASLFASVNLRTAGFNTIDLSQTTDASRFMSLFFMYIGASPGSTGGGIKTTSFMVLIASFFQIIYNSDYGIIYGKRIEHNLTSQAWALIFQSFAWIFIVILVLCSVDQLSLSVASYEVFSAYGTVGVSVGVTPTLTDISKVFIGLTMILGRIGPTTVMLAFVGTRMKQSFISTPEENLSIG